MLFLLFQLGEDHYAIEATKIVAVLPLITPKSLPQAPPAVAGIFDYGGEAVPLIDLSQLALGRPARPQRSTRILVVNYPIGDGDGDVRYLGLIAEQAVETVVRDPAEFERINVQGTRNVIDACRQSGVRRLVQAGHPAGHRRLLLAGDERGTVEEAHAGGAGGHRER